LQLWESGMARLGRVVPCTFNTAVLRALFGRSHNVLTRFFHEQVLFRTTDQSWHGLPDAISAPSGVNRNRQFPFMRADVLRTLTLVQSCRLLCHESSTICIATIESAGEMTMMVTMPLMAMAIIMIMITHDANVRMQHTTVTRMRSL
jgi:hypothetical protein